MAMNSAPSSRYSTASDPITPTRESALAIGCVCTTTLMAETTAIAAKARNKITSIDLSRKQRHQKTRGEQVQHSGREQEFPGEAHQLIVAETWQGAANPDPDKQQKSGLGREPEHRHDYGCDRRNQQRGGDHEEDDGESGQRVSVRAARRLQAVIQANRAH